MHYGCHVFGRSTKMASIYTQWKSSFYLIQDIYPIIPPDHESVIGIISYVGCALSSTGLILTIIRILIFK